MILLVVLLALTVLVLTVREVLRDGYRRIPDDPELLPFLRDRELVPRR